MALTGLLVAALAGSAEPTAGVTSRYARLEQCRDVERAPLGQDWIYLRCNGINRIPVWYVCTDSARCRYGFGARAHTDGMFGTGTSRSSLSEWRGTIQHGRFRPFAVIIRVTSADPDEKKSYLAVYRLRENGTSCIIGEAHTNAAARRIADQAVDRYRCVGEPELL